MCNVKKNKKLCNVSVIFGFIYFYLLFTMKFFSFYILFSSEYIT